MKKNIPIGVSDFGKLVDSAQNYQFVDKSLLIQEIVDDASEVTLITRPRRWGKTLNLSMLEYFLAPKVLQKETHGLFDGLAIAKVEQGRYLEYQGQYPVIFLSFKDVKENKFTLAVDNMREVFQELFSKHKPFLLSTGQLDADDEALLQKYCTGAVQKVGLQRGLLILSKLLYKSYQGKTVYILIDEYDVPLNYAYSHEYLNDMAEFMKNLLSAALKDNPYLKKAVMTGVLRISKDSMLSGLNNVEVHSIMNATYAAHFGFSDAEVRALFAASGLEHEIQEIRKYYNGYRIGDQLCYNPWSIMECLKKNGKLKPYWVNTADDNLLRNTLLQSTSAIKKQLQALISGTQPLIETVVSDGILFEDIQHCRGTALWSLLVATGYLTPRHQEPLNLSYQCQLAIPNEEVKQLYIDIFQNWFLEQLTDAAYFSFLNDLTSGHIDIFIKKLSDYLLSYGSYHDFTHESNYHTFMLGLLCSLTGRYFLYSNAEAGLGRADMMLVPRDSHDPNAIMMEFKRDESEDLSDKSAQAALIQMDSRKYEAFILRHPAVHKILKIGIVFNGKQVVSHYRWDANSNSKCNF